MKIPVCKLVSLFKRLAGDECGGEVMEYALILGIVIVVTIITVAGFGHKVMAKWTSVNSSM